MEERFDLLVPLSAQKNVECPEEGAVIWMERLGYDEPEANIIAYYQWHAGFMCWVGVGILFAIAAAIFQHFDKG